VNRRPAGHITGRAALACAAAAALAAVAAGCSSASGSAAPPPTAHLARTSHGVSVVLTPLGAQRIALRTGQAAAANGEIAVPYGALVYEPNGNPAVYVATGALTYTRYIVPVATITGGTVYLKAGSLPANATVVTQGAEELLGVQNGVGEET
jgi:hypothetical protein